ncbi:DNA polymerase alpha catalytic subunit [Geodia barretti]|uniref:DNA-directed DNA polymerase n=1 Tax=Geodia barretti TaxID=519541 RepID=A0AA35S1N1_GEOBA|nr:DNA polymerase alpha catalytic subunit [Geodia barretti]
MLTAWYKHPHRSVYCRRGRETGQVEETEIEAPEQLFKYVTEDEYSRLVRERQADGFILDDDGSYSEHGREIFDDDETDPHPGGVGDKKRPPGGKAGASKVAKRVAKPGNIKAMVMGMGGGTKRKKEGSKASIVGDELLADMLQKMENRPSSAASPSSRHPSSSTFTTPQRRPVKFTPRLSSTPSSSPHPPPRPHPSPSPFSLTKRVKREHPSPPPPSPPPQPHWDDSTANDDWDGEMGDDDGGFQDNEPTIAEETEKPDVPEAAVSVPEAAVSVSGWETVREDLTASQQQTASQQAVEAPTDLPTQEVDGEEVLQFYWLDAHEMPYRQPGTVFLFGKVWVPASNSHVSCCVVVKNIQRCLYFLPREKILGPSGVETDTPVSFEALYSEFNTKYAEPQRIMKFTSRRVTRHYAFDLPDVPQESEYLQVYYSAEYQAPPTNASGKTFSRVFGTTTSSLEQLVLSRQLKGPCWLHVVQPRSGSSPVSWCRLECVVGGVDGVRVVPTQAPPPPLVTLSLSFALSLNPKTHANEVLCAGCLVHSSVALDKPPPKIPFETDFCAIRSPVDRNFPFGFEDLLKRKRFNVEVSLSERALLAFLLAKIHRMDPDVIVGHNLTGYQLAVLQYRMAACKVPQWSRICRLRRKEMPKGRWAGSQLCAGRPVCDVMTSARELIRARSYDLAELSHTVLRKPHKPLEPDEILQSFNHADQLVSLVAHTMDQSLLSLQLMYELNVLPLAYQITCIAGNIFSRTLCGGRAERNEYLLLHAFTAKYYICPDKIPASKKQPVTEAEEEQGEGGASGVKGRRKPAYTEGLVLEPKKGFYDTFILLLDFTLCTPQSSRNTTYVSPQSIMLTVPLMEMTTVSCSSLIPPSLPVSCLLRSESWWRDDDR